MQLAPDWHRIRRDPPRFTLGQFVDDPFSPHRGREAETRAMLERIGIPFIDTMAIPTPERDPRKPR